jgi:hypothetical protein
MEGMMAVVGVWFEPLSKPEFPANREKYREFFATLSRKPRQFARDPLSIDSRYYRACGPVGKFFERSLMMFSGCVPPLHDG